MTATLIRDLTPKQIWEGYIRIIGAGAVACAGIVTVARAIPTMVNSLKIGVKELKSSALQLDAGRIRTERDLSVKYVILGVAFVVLLITFIPGIIGNDTVMLMRFLGALAIAGFAFCFVTVSSRIVGMIGVSSNPTSGMAIVTLLGTGLIFKLLGWTDLTGKITALTIGTIVCISAAIAGDISQDLKAGFLVGATPRKQQMSELLGAIGSAFFVCLAVYYLGKAYGFGSEELPAPQATLMKTVLDGVLDGNLRWDLVGVGAAFSILVLFFKIPPPPLRGRHVSSSLHHDTRVHRRHDPAFHRKEIRGGGRGSRQGPGPWSPAGLRPHRRGRPHGCHHRHFRRGAIDHPQLLQDQLPGRVDGPGRLGPGFRRPGMVSLYRGSSVEEEVVG